MRILRLSLNGKICDILLFRHFIFSRYFSDDSICLSRAEKKLTQQCKKCGTLVPPVLNILRSQYQNLLVFHYDEYTILPKHHS